VAFFHVMITQDGQGRAFAFNVAEEWVDERIVGPWDRGDEIVLEGQHWDPRAGRTTIFEASEFGVGRGGLEDWNKFVEATGANRTNEFLKRPAGPVAAGATAHEYAEDRRKVMVVLGRNASAGKAMFDFLRSIDLRPLDWTELVGSANSGAPYIGEVLDAAFAQAQAVVVFATPDDIAYLRPDLVPDPDVESDGVPRGQARPNVFFEAGMAIGRFPDRTILTELGDLRPASDLGGRHAVRMNDAAKCRQDLAKRLANAGCLVNADGSDWLTAGDFATPEPIPDGASGDTATADPNPVRDRVIALQEAIQSRKGFVEIGIAEVYNQLISDSGISGLPVAQVRGQTGAEQMMKQPRRSSMTAEEMSTHLGQLLAQL
jgi:predicted nucleotide-binding protein